MTSQTTQVTTWFRLIAAQSGRQTWRASGPSTAARFGYVLGARWISYTLATLWQALSRCWNPDQWSWDDIFVPFIPVLARPRYHGPINLGCCLAKPFLVPGKSRFLHSQKSHSDLHISHLKGVSNASREQMWLCHMRSFYLAIRQLL